MDVHCDETDDPQSRFLEVLAEEARVRGMGSQVTASHTCAMGSYDNAYCSKLFRLLKASGINFISCPTESIHLQGRFDSWPKRRGVTRVAELDRAGINVCFAQTPFRIRGTRWATATSCASSTPGCISAICWDTKICSAASI